MAKTVFQDFDAAFSKVSAFAVIDHTGELIARVSFKTGAAVTCFLHVICTPMTKGRAGGGGYDRNRAAFSVASAAYVKENGSFDRLGEALNFCAKNDGGKWQTKLADAGFKVLEVI